MAADPVRPLLTALEEAAFSLGWLSGLQPSCCTAGTSLSVDWLMDVTQTSPTEALQWPPPAPAKPKPSSEAAASQAPRNVTCPPLQPAPHHAPSQAHLQHRDAAAITQTQPAGSFSHDFAGSSTPRLVPYRNSFHA